MIATVAALVIAAVTLTACTALQHGVTGVMLGPSGRLIAVLGWCPGHAPDGMTLYTEDAQRPSFKVSKFTVDPRPEGTYAEVPLADPPLGWSADPPLLPTLDPQHQYTLSGWTKNTSSARNVDFTVASLKNIGPGRIVFQRLDVKEKDESGVFRLGVEDFQREVRDQDGC
ncbi:MAG: hypothetical protein JWN52_4312 [Actinomycetia bacterium]|nr:hypothetical protein [Actinomycetes bacterium]